MVPIFFRLKLKSTIRLFVVVIHRDHIAVMSASALNQSSGIYTYDFTDALTKAYGGGSGYKQLTAGIFGMVAGDANADGIIGMEDMTLKWKQQAGKKNYLNGDLNLDSQADNKDKNINWYPNSNWLPIPGSSVIH